MDSPKILSLGQDWLFKYVFGNANNQDILRDFLMTILRIPREEFKQLTYTNTDLLRTSEDDKLGILDVRVETASGHDIDIEIQFADMEGMRERIVYYASKMLSSRMRSGYEYGSLKKTIVIVIAHFDWFKTEKNYFHRFMLRDEDTGYVFSDIIEVNTLELPKIPDAPEQAGDHGLWNWAALLAARKEEEFDMLAERSPEMGKVVGLLKELSMDEQVQMMYEAREKARRDHEARIRFAEKEGLARGEARGEIRGAERNKREMALNGLKKGYDINVIMDLTGLSLLDIQALQG
ncbi:MAG: Rpn family recombination-promoting nuclease/putative transposase [Oscillospiraceae bacterium]|jgi:predicted transposase/invertase (TIGR01784 family)|nr:Rpn family recombination-promoting nuclease/putative transposase [Oscillospiraceae bacterium]